MTDTTAPTPGIVGYAALVTGGGSGIGEAAAMRLVRDGAHVVICGRTEDKLAAAVDRMHEVATAVADAGGPVGSARYVVADVTVEDQVAAAIAEAASPRGHLEILVANAGGAHTMGPIADADVDGVRATLDLNVIGTFLCIKHGAPLMKAGEGTGVDGAASIGGSIIGMSSGAGHFPHRYLWAYGSAKAGIDMLCRYAAEELGGIGYPGQHDPAGNRRRRTHGAHHRGGTAPRRLPVRDTHQPPGDGGRHCLRCPVLGRAGVELGER